MNFTSNFTFPNFRHFSNSFLEYDNMTMNELNLFNRIFTLAFTISSKTETILSIIGALGNFAALVTMLKSRSMITPSFVYHKVLVTADLLFCINQLILKLVNLTMSTWVPGNKYLYHSRITAAYVGIVSRALTSSFGYVALYMSTAISVDRFVALIMVRMYDRFNKKLVAWIHVTLCLMLSVLVHSWSTWVEKRIVEIPIQVNVTTMVYYALVDKHNPDLKFWVRTKDIYNMIVRIIYPIFLTFLTGSVIYAYNIQQKRRSTLCTVSKRRLRRERCLFLLMVAVVILTYIQVVPRETKRILDLIYPTGYLIKQMKNRQLLWQERLKCFYIFNYGHHFLMLIQNLCTAIDRSLLFYLYFVLNYSFRREVIRLFHLQKYCFKTFTMATNYGRRKRRHFSSSNSRPGSSPLLRNTFFTSGEISGMSSAIF